jgi:hypothetical protein
MKKSRLPRSHWADFGDFRIENLDEFEAMYETAVASESESYTGLIYEKTSVANLVTLSL